MSIIGRVLELSVANGGIECKTESHGTWISWHTAPGRMFGVADNTAETRKFLRAALARMEKEAKLAGRRAA